MIKSICIWGLVTPEIHKNDQQKIAKLIKEYFKLRKEAKEPIQEAIKEVEEAIEKCLKV